MILITTGEDTWNKQQKTTTTTEMYLHNVTNYQYDLTKNDCHRRNCHLDQTTIYTPVYFVPLT